MRKQKTEYIRKRTEYREQSIESKKHILSAIILIWLALAQGVCLGATTNQISQFGITWTFDKEYEYGQFANGDYWVLDEGTGVNVSSVSPAPTGSESSYRHGSVVNPLGGNLHGYDGRIAGYSSSLSKSFPLALKSGDSLVSTQSIIDEEDCGTDKNRDVTGYCVFPGHSWLYRAAVLTVVSSVPNPNSFRPPYVGTDKPIYLTTDLNKNLLPKLPLSSKPDVSYLNNIAYQFENVWLDHRRSYESRFIHPVKNMPNYGREIGVAVSRASLLLMLDYTDQELETLLINFVQVGIDLYHTKLEGADYKGEGGHFNGRKWPMLFAGIMLDIGEMQDVGNFGEDDQTWYGQPTEDYPIGKPLFGTICTYNNGNWCSDTGAADCRDPNGIYDGCGYRVCCTSHTWVGEALSAMIMTGATGNTGKELWNHDAFFDYVDRWMNGNVEGSFGSGTSFIDDMWNIYRPLLDEPDNTPPLPPTNLISTTQTENSITLSWTAPVPASDGDLASFYRVYRNGTLKGTASTTTFKDTGLSAETSYNYEVYSVDDAGNKSTSAAIGTFLTLTDTTPPSIISVSASETSVEITFSEPLYATSAESTNNYSISNGMSIASASLDTDTVTLTTSAHTEGTYTLTVENVQDITGNLMTKTTIDYEYDDGLVGYWKFDDGSGTIAVDSSGNNNTGTLINGPTWTTGKIDGALSFDDVDDAVQVGTGNLNAGSGSIAFWVNAESFSSTSQYLFGHATQPWSNRIQLYTDDASGNLDLGLGDSHARHTNIQDLNTNTWYHIALTWGGANYVVYVDSVGKASGTYTGLSILETYADIGNNGYSSDRSEAFGGIIDEVRIYDRALNTDEVLELYIAGTTPDIFYGDINGNGEVTSYDAALVARYAVGLEVFTDEQRQKADVSGNGAVSAYDAALIAQKAVGLIERFPVE